MSYEPIGDYSLQLEERWKELFTPLLQQSKAIWTNVAIQTGVTDDAIEPPVIIVYSTQDEEAEYGMQIFKTTLHVQLQSYIKDTAETHRARVAELEFLWQAFDGGSGNYSELSAELSDQNVYLNGIVPQQASTSVKDNMWIWDRGFECFGTWLDPNYGSSSSSSTQESQTSSSSSTVESETSSSSSSSSPSSSSESSSSLSSDSSSSTEVSETSENELVPLN
jgi:hypothetical protein